MHMLLSFPVVQPYNLLFWRGLTKLSELASNPFVFVYAIKYVQFNSNSIQRIFTLNLLSINSVKQIVRKSDRIIFHLHFFTKVENRIPQLNIEANWFESDISRGKCGPKERLPQWWNRRIICTLNEDHSGSHILKWNFKGWDIFLPQVKSFSKHRCMEIQNKGNTRINNYVTHIEARISG